MNKILFTLLIIIYISANVFSQKVDKNIIFPIEAKNGSGGYKNDGGDTLFATIERTTFVVTPKGKLYWGSNKRNSIQLTTVVNIEYAYLHKFKDTLFIFYTEFDGEGATSRVEKINLTTKQRIWKSEIFGFNLGLPYIVNNFAYVTTIGRVGKLDMRNGNYTYSFNRLYDNQKESFNSFDTIIFRNTTTFFISKNWKSKRVDSLIVNEKTLRKKVVK